MNGISNKVSLTEGNIQNIDDENVTVAVSTDVPKELDKLEKDDKQSFEEFKILYKDVITMKCKQDFGDCEDQKLWEDAAKELFLQSKNYILDGEEFKSKENLQEESEKEKKTENVIVTPQVIKENNENEFDDIKPGDEFVNEAGSKIVMLEPTETDEYNFKIINTNTNEEGTGKFSCTFMRDLLKDNHYKKVESKITEKLNSNELITFSKKFLEAESEKDLEKLCNEIQFYSEPTYKRVKEIIDSEGSVQYKAQQISDILYQINDPKGLVESNDNDITYIFEQYDWKFDITTKDQLGSDYSYHTLVKTVDEAEKFNYHSDYWGDADTYQEEVVDVVRSFEPYIDEEVTITYDGGEKEKFKVIGVLIDKQYNSISHLKILVEPLGELKTEDHKSIKQLNATDFVSLIDNIKKMDLWDGKDETFKDAVEKYYSILDTQSKLKNEGTILSEEQLREEADSPEFKYQLLDRLKSDCEYFLKAGNRNEKHLWAGNVDDQIAKMKELWNSLEEKPEWLSMEDIENYEKEMKQDTVEEAYDISYHLAEYDKVLRGDNDTYCIKIENRTAQTETKWLLVDKAYVEKMKNIEYDYKQEESKLNEHKLSDKEIEILRKRMTDTVKQYQKFKNDEDLEKYIDEFMPMWIEMQQNLGTTLTESQTLEESYTDKDITNAIKAVSSSDKGIITDDSIYDIVEKITGISDINQMPEELIDRVKSFLKPKLQEDKFFNLYKSFDDLYGINKMNPKELIKFFDDLKKMNRISDKDYNVMIDYANNWQSLIDKTGYNSEIVEESKEVKTEDQYEAERRKGRPNLDKIAKEVFEYDDYYIDIVDNYKDEWDFVKDNVAEVAAEYNLREQAAEAVMRKIYKMAKDAVKE